ncbi:hypothetical protein [Mycetocola saprophilus]|uniref:hypothetical protein n=1 Tax=Mycetocola saprophilus TaxID=76636 RepID=UPI0004C22C9E|nr:hypothetical protein [Mycetocola saprophilus]
MKRNSYELVVSREGRWWIIDVPAIDYRTQAHTLSEVEEMGRSLIAGALNREEDSFDISVTIEKPADVARRLADAAELDRVALESAQQAARDRRAAARALRDAYGLSAIDSATVLGISRARIYQLLDDSERSAAEALNA